MTEAAPTDHDPVMPALLTTALLSTATLLGPAGLAGRPAYESHPVTADQTFTFGIEGISATVDGHVYAMNLGRQGTVGKLAPDGKLTLLATLPDGGVGNGSRIGPDGALYVADYKRHRIHRIDPRDGAQSVVATVPGMHQPNDLAITDGGIIYASDPDWKNRSGQVWLVARDGAARVVLPGLGTANGIEVSPDGRTLYVSESMQRRILAFDLDAAGNPGNRRVLHTWDREDVDGLRADRSGALYLTRNGLGTVEILDQTGRLLRTVKLGGRNPTNLAFGGADGRTVFVTMRDRRRIEAFRVETPGREWVQQTAWGLKAAAP